MDERTAVLRLYSLRLYSRLLYSLRLLGDAKVEKGARR
jgi:hypothetical protein